MLDLFWMLDVGCWMFSLAPITLNLVSETSPPASTGRLTYLSPARTRQLLNVNSFSGDFRSVNSTYFLRTARLVNCSVSERLARGVFEKTITPEVSLSNR